MGRQQVISKPDAFQGRIIVKEASQPNTIGKYIDISKDSFLPEGTVLVESGHILALICYVGNETSVRSVPIDRVQKSSVFE